MKSNLKAVVKNSFILFFNRIPTLHLIFKYNFNEILS